MLIFHWFCKVFHCRENAFGKPSVGNAFSMCLKPLLRFWPKFHQNTICFTRFPATQIWLLEKLIFHWFYKVFHWRENVVAKPSLRNAFSMFWTTFRDFGFKSVEIPLGFSYILNSVHHDLQNVVLPMLFQWFWRPLLVQKWFSFHFWAPDPEVGPDFLQRPSLRHLAGVGSAGQNF